VIRYEKDKDRRSFLLDNLVYEDDPWGSPSFWGECKKILSDSWVWTLQISPVMSIVFIAGMILAAIQIEQEAVFKSILVLTLFIMLVIHYALMPTRYQIYNDGIRIVRGWKFHFDIPFGNIYNVTVAKSNDLGFLNLNFINSFSSDDILQITRKHGAKVNITPLDRKPFLEHLTKALNDWRRNNPN
jgi:hypothetical protein